jgi:hypothetical protein
VKTCQTIGVVRKRLRKDLDRNIAIEVIGRIVCGPEGPHDVKFKSAMIDRQAASATASRQRQRLDRRVGKD